MIELIFLLLIWFCEKIGAYLCWSCRVGWVFIKFTCWLLIFPIINGFTLIFTLAAYALCKLFKKSTPKLQHNRQWIFYPTWNYNVESMTGVDFEHYCAEWLMKNKNFKKVVVTPPSGDYGADLVAYDRKGECWVFQCKHYGRKVTNSAVQEAVTAKAHYKAARAAVMTNSQLTEKARELAFENDVLLFELLDD